MKVYISRIEWVAGILLTALLSFAGPLAVFSNAQASVDDRVYELVSPAQKSGGVGGVLPLGSLTHSLEQFYYPLQSSPDGNAIAYQGEDFYLPHFGNVNQYVSQRGSSNWSTQNLTPGVPSTIEGIGENLFLGFSPTLSIGIVNSEDLLAKEAPKGYLNLYLVERSYLQPVITTAPANRASATFGYAYNLGESSRVERRLLFAGGNEGTNTVPAFSDVLLAANDALTGRTAAAPAAVDGGRFQNNLYEWANNGLHLINVLPNGETEPGVSFGINYGDIYNNRPMPNLDHVISADGSKVFWTDENAGSPDDGNLYVREDGERTKLVASNGQFQTASVDGTRAFFIKEGRLYKYNTDAGATIELSDGGGVEGVAGTSNDGLSVYFVSTSALAGNAQPGKPNLYLSREYSPGEYAINFVATLLPEDNEISGFYGSGATPQGDWYRTFAGRTAEVSPDGRYIAFVSQKSLTGYDNSDAVFGGFGVKDSEIYLYDSSTAALMCVSCNTDGSRPVGQALLPAPFNGIYQQRYLDDNGRLFFSTVNAVLSQDTDGSSDVYEYENGNVHLISLGTENEAIFADASESGNDVFFTTRAQLVPGDQDQIIDLYDARVDGRTEAPSASPCLDEACHAFPAAPPSFEAPVSAVFNGPGDTTPSVTTTKASTTRTVKKRHPKRAKRNSRPRGRGHRAKSRRSR